jgi:hypothetical protein
MAIGASNGDAKRQVEVDDELLMFSLCCGRLS